MFSFVDITYFIPSPYRLSLSRHRCPVESFTWTSTAHQYSPQPHFILFLSCVCFVSFVFGWRFKSPLHAVDIELLIYARYRTDIIFFLKNRSGVCIHISSFHVNRYFTSVNFLILYSTQSFYLIIAEPSVLVSGQFMLSYH